MAEISVWLRRANQTDREAIDVSISKQKRLIDLKRAAAEALNLTSGVADVALRHEKYSFEDNRALLDSLLGQYSEDDVICVVEETAQKPAVATTPEVVLVRRADSRETVSVKLADLKRVMDLKRSAHQALKLGGSVADMSLAHPKYSFDDNRAALFPLLANYAADEVLVVTTNDKEAQTQPVSISIQGDDGESSSDEEGSDGESSDEEAPRTTAAPQPTRPAPAANVAKTNTAAKTNAAKPSTVTAKVNPAKATGVKTTNTAKVQNTSDSSESDNEVATFANPAPPLGHDIFVGGLPADTKDIAVLNHFSRFGKVAEVSLSRDLHKKTCRGFGFVKFEKPESAKAAAAQAKQTMGTYTLSIRPATTSTRRRKPPPIEYPKVDLGSDISSSSEDEAPAPKPVSGPPKLVAVESGSDSDSSEEETTTTTTTATTMTTTTTTVANGAPAPTYMEISDADGSSSEEESTSSTAVGASAASTAAPTTGTVHSSSALLALLDDSSESDENDEPTQTNTTAAVPKLPPPNESEEDSDESEGSEHAISAQTKTPAPEAKAPTPAKSATAKTAAKATPKTATKTAATPKTATKTAATPKTAAKPAAKPAATKPAATPKTATKPAATKPAATPKTTTKRTPKGKPTATETAETPAQTTAKRPLPTPSPAQPADKKQKTSTSSELQAPSWKNCVLLENLPQGTTNPELAEYITNLGYTVSAIKRDQTAGFVGFADASACEEIVGLAQDGGLFFKGQALECKKVPPKA